MANNENYITIPKKVETKNDLDYAFLRKRGLEYIESLSSAYWTDYNVHDPGITMLEVLCYAITDLGNRINQPTENILQSGENATPFEHQFFRASEILPNKALTANDYRKLFIDIDGVKNCWLIPADKNVFVGKIMEDGEEKHQLSYTLFANERDRVTEFKLQGLCSLLVDTDEESLSEELEGKIRSEYHKNRNLCEDLVEIQKVGTHPIEVCAKIEIDPNADEEKIYAAIELAIERYFSPPINFYSIKQMLEKGYSSEAIFDGPLLNGGFIDTKELEQAELRSEVRLSDIMRLIMNVEGVRVITEISMSDEEHTGAENWFINIGERKKPKLSFQSRFNLYKGVLPVSINKSEVSAHKLDLIEKEEQQHANGKVSNELEIPQGDSTDLSYYTTVQNDFPETYGIGKAGVEANANTKRKAQAKQLKAYLLFFDQVLASYFAHLEKVKEQLSVRSQFIDNENNPVHTYFTQVVNDLKDIRSLVSEDYDFSDAQSLADNLFQNKDKEITLDKRIARNNILLDHLIARFAERFSEYSFIMKELYGDFAAKAVLKTKQGFLNDYPRISSERASAYNYKLPDEVWNTANVSGFERRIARLIGMQNSNRRNLAKSTAEIYIEKGDKPNTVYRWRIRNNEGKIILSATDDYATPRLAEEEMFQAVIKITEMTSALVQKAFKNGIEDGAVFGNIQVRKSRDDEPEKGKYSFNIVNPAADPQSVDYIIARQFSYYETKEDLEKAIITTVDFFVSEFSDEGMFLVEHILLRPGFSLAESVAKKQFMPLDSNDDCAPVDPYSYRVTIVLPGWTYRFANVAFRRHTENLIRAELPAHILPRICWVGYRSDYYQLMLETNEIQIEKQSRKLNDLYEERSDGADAETQAKLDAEYAELLAQLEEKRNENREKYKDQLADLEVFENDFEKYLTNLATNEDLNFEPDSDDNDNEEPLSPCQKLVRSMGALNTIYQQGKLFDCKDETEELKGNIILDQTNLGTL